MGLFSISLKQMFVQPLFKNLSQDPDKLMHYTLISKLLKRVIAKWFISHANTTNLLLAL